MPRQVTIDGLHVDDGNTPEGYEGMYYFTDPDSGLDEAARATPMADRPFPYAPCERVTVRGLETASGLRPRVSPNSSLATTTAIVEGG